MPTMRAPAKRWRIARSAGVAITTSPTQFGKKTAIFIADFRWQFQIADFRCNLQSEICNLQFWSRRPHLLDQPARRVTVMQRRKMNAAAVGLDELRANHL